MRRARYKKKTIEAGISLAFGLDLYRAMKKAKESPGERVDMVMLPMYIQMEPIKPRKVDNIDE